MEGALVIALFTIIVGIVLYIFELRWRRKRGNSPAEDKEGKTEAVQALAEPADVSGKGQTAPEDSPSSSEGCCGMHLVCEKDTLMPLSPDIVYYDDEELDRFADRDGNDYTPEETEEFREVLMTLHPEDVIGWARSITQRRLNLPPDVRDELLMLVNEQRAEIRK